MDDVELFENALREEMGEKPADDNADLNETDQDEDTAAFSDEESADESEDIEDNQDVEQEEADDEEQEADEDGDDEDDEEDSEDESEELDDVAKARNFVKKNRQMQKKMQRYIRQQEQQIAQMRYQMEQMQKSGNPEQQQNQQQLSPREQLLVQTMENGSDYEKAAAKLRLEELQLEKQERQQQQQQQARQEFDNEFQSFVQRVDALEESDARTYDRIYNACGKGVIGENDLRTFALIDDGEKLLASLCSNKELLEEYAKLPAKKRYGFIVKNSGVLQSAKKKIREKKSSKKFKPVGRLEGVAGNSPGSGRVQNRGTAKSNINEDELVKGILEYV